jgi:hypothetical protein
LGLNIKGIYLGGPSNELEELRESLLKYLAVQRQFPKWHSVHTTIQFDINLAWKYLEEYKLWC